MMYNLVLFAQGLLGPPEDIGIPDNAITNDSVALLLNSVYIIAAVIAIIVLIIAGMNYVTSAGDANKMTKAKNMIIYTVIGLVIVFGAFVITNFVITEAS